MIEDSNFENFCETFNIVDNALDMRTLQRWNGRDLRNHENLAEHTHLVVACAIELLEKFVTPYFMYIVSFKKIIKYCMCHDSLEMLRGDILSITKDVVPGLRAAIDAEEKQFLHNTVGEISDVEARIVRLADLMACYKFIERELQYPGNDFTAYAYINSKKRYEDEYERFCKDFDVCICKEIDDMPARFLKGYERDAGADITLDKSCVFMPMSTTSFGLNVKITPKEGEMAVLCARTSAAAKGLVVAMCPIDTDYCGEVTAIVHNVSNNIIEYSRGESFCQVVMLPTNTLSIPYKVKREGKRTDGKLGSTGR